MSTEYELAVFTFPHYPRMVLMRLLIPGKPSEFKLTRKLVFEFEQTLKVYSNKGILIELPEGTPAVVGAALASVAHRIAPEGMAFHDPQTNSYRVVWKKNRNPLGWDELYAEIVFHLPEVKRRV